MFTAQKFNIPELKGISKRTIDEHIKLYEGYVKNLNQIHEIVENVNNPEYARRESYRRQGFEFGGMRNHEYYFNSLSDGSTTLTTGGQLMLAIEKDFDSFENWLTVFKGLAMTKGIGWAMLSYDKKTGQLLNHWVDEQHIGHLVSTSPILALDMWEHAYVYDYPTSEKKKYIDAFFENVNWEVIEKNFIDAQKQ